MKLVKLLRTMGLGFLAVTAVLVVDIGICWLCIHVPVVMAVIALLGLFFAIGKLVEFVKEN